LPEAVVKGGGLELDDQRLAFLHGLFEPVRALLSLGESQVSPCGGEFAHVTAAARLDQLPKDLAGQAMTITAIGGKITGMETYRRIVRNSKPAPKRTAETARAIYGTSVQGALLTTAPAPYSGIGVFAIDHRGEIAGGSTVSIAGQQMEAEVVEASVQVLEDCRVKPKEAPAAGPGRGIDKVMILDDGEDVQGSISREQPEETPSCRRCGSACRRSRGRWAGRVAPGDSRVATRSSTSSGP
jgi:hypothetical protein